MKTQLLCLFFLLILFSCKDKDSAPHLNEEIAKRRIIGKWENTSFRTYEYDKDGKMIHTDLFNPVKAYYTFGESSFNYEDTDLLQNKMNVDSITYNISTINKKVMISFSQPYSLYSFIENTSLYEIVKVSSNEMQWKSEVINKNPQSFYVHRKVRTGSFVRR